MPTAAVRGRTDVTARALQRTVTAIAAEQLRVPIGDVRVTLADETGLLGISIVAPVRLPPLHDAADVHMVARSREARERIREIANTTIDRTIGTVSVRLTRAAVMREKRTR